jgi:hypothetical protein
MNSTLTQYEKIWQVMGKEGERRGRGVTDRGERLRQESELEKGIGDYLRHRRRSVEVPGINMLTHSGEDNAKEPAVAARGAGLGEMAIVFLAFDGAFGTRTGVIVELPEGGISRDKSMPAIVTLGIGIDDAAVGGVRTAIGEERTGGQGGSFLGGSQGTTPLDTTAVGTKACAFHGAVGEAEGNALDQTEGAGIGKVVLVAGINGDDEGRVPALGGEMIEAPSVMSGIQGGDTEGKAAGFAGMEESGQRMDTIMTITVSQGDEEGQLTRMA